MPRDRPRLRPGDCSMSRTCAACGAEDARNQIGGTLACERCRPALMDRLDSARRAGHPADAGKEARAMLRETSANYLLRDIPADLWQSAKHVAVDRGVSLRDLLLGALRRDLDNPPARN